MLWQDDLCLTLGPFCDPAWKVVVRWSVRDGNEYKCLEIYGERIMSMQITVRDSSGVCSLGRTTRDSTEYPIFSHWATASWTFGHSTQERGEAYRGLTTLHCFYWSYRLTLIHSSADNHPAGSLKMFKLCLSYQYWSQHTVQAVHHSKLYQSVKILCNTLFG